MIACLVEENHDNWDRFLHEFSFELRTAINETTGKTPAELFLGRKIITPFRKLARVMEDAEYGGGNTEKLFDEARQNMQRQHKTWEKYYNRKTNSDTNSFDSSNETLYEGKGWSTWSNRSNSGKSRRSRKPSGNENKSGKSNKGNAGLEDPRVKRTRPIVSTGISEKPEILPGTSNQGQTRRSNTPHPQRGREARVQSDRARETRTTGSKGHSANDGRLVQSRKTTTGRPCPYYLRSRFKEPEWLPEEQSTGIDSLPQNNLRRRSLSMEALDGGPANRST
ncbi:uncharacterized protein TNCV_1275731 [Trichonephila clavipes]|nr:uncharacterized protein TNCV_1275731 [Trichonephila clavipes]